MKILIGTPIHEIKDYAIKRWLKSVSEIEVDKKDSWRLLMVDNSQNKDWQERVKEYCREINFANYDLISLPDMKDGENFEAERLAFSREKIRETLLEGNYDFWFSWESDIICPPDILKYLLKFGNEFEAIYHTYPARGTKPLGACDNFQEQDGIGCVLFARRIFYNFKFSEGDLALGGDGRLLFEVMRKGYKIIEIHNIFRLEHLGK
jgi:hypothetical protein